MKSALRLVAIIAATTGLVGCSGSIGEPGQSWTNGPPSDDTVSGSDTVAPTPDADATSVDDSGGNEAGDTAGGTDTTGGTDTGVDVPPVNACEGVLFQSSSAPIRRLSTPEYRNTVATLFGGVALPPLMPVPDARVEGFANHADGQPASPLGVQTYRDMAESVGAAAAADLAAWAPCTDDSDACVTAIAQHLGPLAYRRPLETAESNALTAFATGARSDHGFAMAVQMTVQVLLESPFFLFRPEYGGSQTVGDGTAVLLDDWEMASRLSYFFLQDMPDQALRDAAAAGTLTDPATIEAQALRLMAMPAARPVLTGFLSEWLRVYKLDELALDPATFPEFSPAMADDMKASLDMFLDKVLWEDDSFAALFGGSFAFVNDTLAPLYGVASPGGSDFVETALDPAQRRGVLTQVGLLASTSHGVTHSPIFRGVTMLDSVLCAPATSPPDGLLDNLEPLDVDPADICTTRDYFTMTHTARPGCPACHTAIDGAGYTFEHYDALGRYRDTENGCAIDASGTFPDADFGDVTDAVDLADKLVGSQTASECMTKNLFRFALGRTEQQGDTCEIRALAKAMQDGGGSLQGLILELVKSPSFRSRPTAQ